MKLLDVDRYICIVSAASFNMRAIRVSSFGGPEVLKLIADVPVPTVSKGQVRLGEVLGKMFV